MFKISCRRKNLLAFTVSEHFAFQEMTETPVVQWIKRWLANLEVQRSISLNENLSDRKRSSTAHFHLYPPIVYHTVKKDVKSQVTHDLSGSDY